jgi:hypothetical protein
MRASKNQQKHEMTVEETDDIITRRDWESCATPQVNSLQPEWRSSQPFRAFLSAITREWMEMMTVTFARSSAVWDEFRFNLSIP